MTLINVIDRSASLEICRTCYTGCPYCYLTNQVGPKRKFLSLQKIKDRILWLKEFTDIKYIYILGGEPLTHPDFQKICNLLISQNIDTHVVTSGKISKLKYEENNLKYMLRMYSEGLVSIDLSYHDERNEMVYKKILQAIKARYLKYRKNREKLGLGRNQYDLFTNIVVHHDSLPPYEEFAKKRAKAYGIIGWPSAEDTYGKEIYDIYREEQIKGGEKRLSFNIYHVDGFEGFKVRANLLSPIKINKNGGMVSIVRNGDGTCPSISTTIKDSGISTPSIHIRLDGGVTYPQAECIDMTHPFINVDSDTEKRKIMDHFKRSMSVIKKMIYFYNRKKAAENCNEDDTEKECTSCPFGTICTECWKLEK